MQRVVGEVFLWQREAVVELLRDALGVVAEVEPPAELVEATFAQACGLLAQKNVQLEQVAMAVPTMTVPRG